MMVLRFLELVNLNLNQLDIVLPLLREAVLETSVVVCVHLVALEMNLERSTLFNTFVTNVIEPFVADELDGR